MVDVFISYPRRDLEKVRPIHDALRALGLELFFDVEGGIDGGQSFPPLIDAAVKRAKAVLGCWNDFALTREWVQIECDIAKSRGVLVATEFEPIDQNTVPALFWHISRESLVGFAGEDDHFGWAQTLQALAAKLDQWADAHIDAADAEATHEQAARLRREAFAVKRRAIERGAVLDAQQPQLSPAAQALAAISNTLDIEEYRDVEEVFVGTSEALEARKRRRQLEIWRAVDQSDLASVRTFERTLPFTALAHEVRRVAAALEEQARLAEEERRRVLSTPLAVFRDTLRSGGEGPEMVVIPEGEFMMGSPTDEPERRDTESPQHLVRIADRFALGKYAVTRGEFGVFVSATSHDMSGGINWFDGKNWRRDAPKSWRDPGFTQDDRHPVVGVSWEDANAFCRWLSDATGAEYRLPSEAEWEYACRGQCSAEAPSTPFWWGREITPEQANYDGNDAYAGGGGKGVYRKKTVPVDLKEFKANPFKLHQMHGNVWEWCADAWNDSYNGAPDDGSAWTSGGTSRAVRRGGSWLEGPWNSRSAGRLSGPRVVRSCSLGFRVARTIIPS
ncbi:MAG: SUMF1/EgtB/PvdO family nonheme iron enzyme [Neomegalonema sp.]|nr:SUMF1/EgtB/PvdO family nonheme iron enzyme [Neomegalonema sp.]